MECSYTKKKNKTKLKNIFTKNVLLDHYTDKEIRMDFNEV